MNQLDPHLKRLLRWSRQVPLPDEAPPGFSTRVAARWNQNQTAFPLMQTYVTVAAWVSALVILCGVIFFAKQTRAPKIALDFTSAAQFVASHITP